MQFEPPSPLRSPSDRRRLLRALALAACVVAGVWGLASASTLDPGPTNRLRDDAYYEFTWAANLARGRGPTVSDGVTTSGVQYLWSLLLVPFAQVFGAASLPLVAPWLGLALHVATAALWWLGSRSRLAGAGIAACWLGHPLLVRESQNGQETALACLLVTCLWLFRRARERHFVALAVLAVFARSDLLLAVSLLSVWRHRRRLRGALLAPGAALALHVAANVALGGGVWQDSALPMAWLWHNNQRLADPTVAAWWHAAWWYSRPALLGHPFALASAMGIGYAVFAIVRPWWPVALRALPALLVGGACASGARDLATAGWAAMLVAVLPAPRRRAMPWALAALFAGLAGIVVLHWGVRWYPRDYYVAPLAVAAFAAVARHARCPLLLLTFAIAQVADCTRVRPEPLAGQVEMQMAGAFLHEVLPAPERAGCFNAGLVAFHAGVLATGGERRIVDLDGVVDARTFGALRRGALSAWLDDQGVRFVLDNAVQFASDPKLPHACGAWFGGGFDAARDLVEVARFDAPHVDNGRRDGDSMRLYWRRGRGEPPRLPEASRDLGLGPDGARYVAWVARAGEQLQCEAADGTREPLVAVDVATVVVVRLDERPRGACRLFVAGAATPVLQLAPL